MLLYEIFRHGSDFDSARPLPKTPPDDARYARCVNGEREYLVPRGGVWVSVPRDEAIKGRA